MSCEIHLNDVGTEFRVKVVDCSSNAIDVSSATSKKMIFKKPDGNTLSKDASFVTDGTDGYLKYLAVSGDISQIGTWKIQVKVDLSSGTWYSNFQSFKVHRNL